MREGDGGRATRMTRIEEDELDWDTDFGIGEDEEDCI